ncbi:HTH CENPB-type domain-containing protein [Fusarium keratoplasticum]|uniref:HTH CENPB-type domain-containing protein n=1 Tax=Fusarium keratoplasticum TaxID=1328300 RepID=A0ACC0R431_9HYPO|nr:HTH CENPB-type domain-containing protein [Fusarium keratoplasticum]KAI8671511.1 HTH CENPB-type domain-containing protein [Fusarium keratoplasticum]KAI8678737.1 HTH CENPB-type domain-containing protein [Fusarium keratoplasticum]
MNNVNGTSTMGHDTIMAQSNGSSNSNGYGSDTWTSMSPYSQSPYSASPLTEYPSFGAFVSHGMPSEPLNRMPPPPPQPHQMIQPAPPPPPMAHHQLPMLNTTWPSQLTNPTPSGSYSAPPLSITPATSAPPVDPPRLPTQHEKSRKTLTTEQKRAMCQFHEDNPGTRQADIGARFGVERSTVSKVLRHKDQYLKRDQEPENPAVKRGKGKHPDFDRTLSNYVRRQQQRGFKVSDEEIMEQARLFAHASGNQENVLNGLTSSWLQKFKQKHGIGGAKLTRRASEANIPDSARLSTLVTKNNSSQDILSPTSPTGNISPLSGSRSDEDGPIDGIDFDFTYKHPESQSTTSLSSDLRDNPASSFSGTMSPTGTFTFSPDPNVGGFPMDQLRGADFQSREKRSNTFPSLNIDYVNQVSGSTEPMTPRHIPSSTAPSSALESPQHELHGAPFSIDTSVNSPPPTLRRSSSNSSIARSTATCPTPVDSSPVSPSQEDARRAAQTLLTYIQTAGNFDSNDYITIVQLTKKLKIHQHQGGRPSIGGLSRIPEGDVEAPALISAKMETT